MRKQEVQGRGGMSQGGTRSDMGLCGKGPVPEGRGHRKVWEIGRQRNQAVVGLATEKF